LSNIRIQKLFIFSLLISPFSIDPWQGRIQGGGGATPGARPPKIGKKYYFLAKNRDFSHEIPQNVRASLGNWKKYDFLA
jgi:hypothetical protein